MRELLFEERGKLRARDMQREIEKKKEREKEKEKEISFLAHSYDFLATLRPRNNNNNLNNLNNNNNNINGKDGEENQRERIQNKEKMKQTLLKLTTRHLPPSDIGTPLYASDNNNNNSNNIEEDNEQSDNNNINNNNLNSNNVELNEKINSSAAPAVRSFTPQRIKHSTHTQNDSKNDNKTENKNENKPENENKTDKLASSDDYESSSSEDITDINDINGIKSAEWDTEEEKKRREWERAMAEEADSEAAEDKDLSFKLHALLANTGVREKPAFSFTGRHQGHGSPRYYGENNNNNTNNTNSNTNNNITNNNLSPSHPPYSRPHPPYLSSSSSTSSLSSDLFPGVLFTQTPSNLKSLLLLSPVL